MTFPGRWQTLLEHEDSEGMKVKVYAFPDGMALISLEWTQEYVNADSQCFIKSTLVPLEKLREAVGVKP